MDVGCSVCTVAHGPRSPLNSCMDVCHLMSTAPLYILSYHFNLNVDIYIQYYLNIYTIQIYSLSEFKEKHYDF